ncbi:MAG: hypothetical protein GTO18_02570 [Anaerolineales bacterium]|nr:hypothetical protein [Anaerolineales bacterium]
MNTKGITKDSVTGEEKPETSISNRLKIVVVVSFIFFLLLASAYAIGGLMGDRPPDAPSAGIVDAASGYTVSSLENAEELPDSAPTLWGLVDHHDGNSILVKQLPELDQIIEQASVEFGATFEVVITKRTILYKDVTSGPARNGVVQEEVAPGDADEIEEGNIIKVWGEKRGDRIVAEILKYDNHTQIVLPSGPIN